MTKIPDNKLKGFIQTMLSDRKERKFVESIDLQIGLKVRFVIHYNLTNIIITNCRIMIPIKIKDFLDQLNYLMSLDLNLEFV